MPPKAASPSTRDAAAGPASPLVCSHHCPFPAWDDAQIAQENWGSILSATSAAGNAADGPSDGNRGGSAKAKAAGGQSASAAAALLSDGSGGAEGHFEDTDGHHCVTVFIQECQRRKTTAAAANPAEVAWRRPVDIFRPFRPVVHRNATPFVNPYAADGALTPLEAKVEEEAHRAPSAAGASVSNTGGNKKSNAGVARNADGAGGAAAAAVTESFHQQYPEAVTVLEDFVGDDATRWSHCSSVDAIRRYRALPVLMQPYDGALVAGCAETPAEAVGSRYSTALRHKLRQAEQLSALSEAPPYLMTALSSALLAVEQAQRYIPAGSYLWELVYPHAPGTCHPVYNPHGKYAVKLFVAGAYRKVVVDDRLPVDVLGRPLLSTTSLKELWPALLGKAIVKALGPTTGVEALAASPELIVSALLGNWVPQYLSPHHDTVATMTALLLYERHLKRLAAATEPILPEADGEGGRRGDHAAAEDGEAGAKKDGKGAGGGRAASAGQRRSVDQRKRPSAAGAKSDAAAEAGKALQTLTATEFCAAVVDEPLPEQAMYMGALYAVKSTTSSSRDAAARVGGGATPSYQLLTIHAMRPFRNTYALLLHTTPTLPLSDGVFEKEKDADDVSTLLRWTRQHHHHHELHRAAVNLSRPPTASVNAREAAGVSEAPAAEMVALDDARDASVTARWLTLEEFMAQVQQVVVWRVLDGAYANTKTITGEAVLQFNGISAAGGAGEIAAGVSPSKSPSPASKALPATHDDPTPNATAAETPQQKAAAAVAATGSAGARPFYATQSPTCVWWRLTTEKAVDGVVVVSSPTPTEASTSSVSAAPDGTAATGAEAAERRIDFHHFEWQRAEALNHMGSLVYRDGALRSTVLRFRPGTHLVRVDMHDLRHADTFAFLSDAATMTVQLAPAYDFAQDGFATVLDAGTYPAIAAADVEYVWLKRVFTLSKPTCLTAVLSTLGSDEDLAAHRRINTATQHAPAAALATKSPPPKAASPPPAPAASAVAPRGVAAARSGSMPSTLTTKKNSSVDGVAEDRARHLSSVSAAGDAAVAAAEPSGVALLRYTTLLLLNLDKPEEECLMGCAGKLVQQRLEPNDKGYLLVAYSSVPESAVAGLAAAARQDSRQAGNAPAQGLLMALATTTNAEASEAAAALPETDAIFEAGQWALTLHSDVELNTFDALAHNTHDVTVEADFPRGGSEVFFRRVCAVAETTHLSILAQLRSPLPMPYTLRITRAVPAAGPEMLSTSSTAAGAALSGAAKASPSAGLTSPTAVSDVPFPVEEGGATAVSSVYESEPTASRLFVADVLLPCAHEGTTKTGKAGGGGGGGGAGAAPTTYVIEAVVSAADAAAWEEQCRRRQEETFIQLRDAAEERAAALQQSDLAEFQQDPEAFLQRRRDTAAQRRLQLAETAEKTVSHAQAEAASAEARTSRTRSSSNSRRQSRRVSNAVDTFIKDSFRRPSSSTTEDAASDAATLALLDGVDAATLAHLSVQLSFSSPRAEVREEVSAMDAVAELRLHMRETMEWLQPRIGGRAAGSGRNGLSSAGSAATAAAAVTGGTMASAAAASGSAAAGGGASAKAAAPRNQREGGAAAASLEDALRAKLARQSRLAYLRNPQHLFIPSFEILDRVDDAELGSAAQQPPHGSVAAGGSSAAASASGKAKPHDSSTAAAGHPASGSGAAAAAGGGSGAGGRAAGGNADASPGAAAARVSSIASETATPGAAGGQLPGHEVVMQDGPATHFRYAAPLEPSQFRVELLPLRSHEETPATAASREKDAGGSAGGAAGAAGSKRPKASAAGVAAGGAASTAKATTPTSALTANAGAGGGAVGICGPSTLAHPLTTAECDALVWPLQAPLLEAMKSWESSPSSAAAARPMRAEHNAQFRTSFHSYFEAAASKRAAPLAPGGGEAVVESVLRPVVYHSLLGIKEEDLSMTMKSKKSMAAV